MILAYAKAGHDQGETYVVIKEDEKYYYLANGTNKTLSSLKKKNKKHLQLIKRIPEEQELQCLAQKLDAGELIQDTEVKRILTIYQKCRRDTNV